MHSFISSCVLLAVAHFVLSRPIVIPVTTPVDLDNVIGPVNDLTGPVTNLISATGLEALIPDGLVKRQVDEVDDLVSEAASLPALAESYLESIENLANVGVPSIRSLPNLNDILGNSQISVDSVAGQIYGVIENTPAASVVIPLLSQLNTILTSASDQIGQLTGIPITSILENIESTPLPAQQAAQTLANIANKVSSTVNTVEGATSSSAPEVQPSIDSINNSVASLFTTFNNLDSTLSEIAAPILAQVTPVANTLGLSSLPIVGSL